MKQIRNNVFETNSSSVHSIAIPKNCEQVSRICFSVGEFGWGFEQADPADYFYTALFETSKDKEELVQKLDKLKSILDSYGIDYEFDEPEYREKAYDDWKWLDLDYGYIDHASELIPFVDELLEDGDKLIRFLSHGLVFTGNDNADDEERAFISRTEEEIEVYDYDYKTGKEKISKVKNPYYMDNWADYEWECKGN